MIQSFNKIILSSAILKKVEFIKNKTKNKPIILVGMMGSGKTSVGKLLAKNLKKKFYDLDKIIENKENASINDIFDKFGEKEFRKIECDELVKIKNYNSIIATGGGAYINKASRTFINKIGLTIWLKANRAIILKRTKNNKDRPLLIGSDIINKIEKLLKDRNPIYAQANIHVETLEKDKLFMTKNVLESIEKFLIDNPND